jgi:hypothetical protein
MLPMIRTILTIGVLIGGVYLGQLWAQESSSTSTRHGLRIHNVGPLCIYVEYTTGGMWGIRKDELHLTPDDACPGVSPKK